MRRVLYAAPIDFTRKEYERDVYVDELLRRLQLTFGSYIANLAPSTNIASALTAGGGFGIVGTYDPAKAPLDLAVVADQNSANTVAIQIGTAVFPNGEIIVIDRALSGIPVASTAPGAVNVVYLQFSEEETDPELTHGNVLVNTKVQYLTNPNQYFGSVSITTWQGFNSQELSTKIPLAVVSVDASSTLQIDQSRSFLNTNRPWFTPVDIQHRSQIGTGIVTAANPHGMSVNDLSASAGSTILDLLTTSGQVVSRDTAMSKVPGYMCQDIIPYAQIKQDVSGAVTGQQNYWYFFLSRYPTQLVRTTIQNTGNPTDEVPDLAAMLLPGRNMVVLGQFDEQILNVNKSLICEYICTDALAPTDQPLITQNLIFKGPRSTTDETIVANGLIISQPVLTHGMADAGPFPSLYRTYLRGDSFIYKTPQPVFCYMLLSQMGTAVQAASISMLGPARLRVGLTGATANPALDVQVKLIGTDMSNAQITETITYGATWAQDISIGTVSETAILNSKIYKTTNLTFQTLQSVQILAALNAGSAAAIAVWADHDGTGTSSDPLLNGSYTGSGAAKGLPLVDFVWDGARVAMDPSVTKPVLTDIRPVGTSIQPVRTSPRIDAAAALYRPGAGVPPGSPTWWSFYEDFDKPLLLANRYVYENATQHDAANTAETPRFKTSKMSKLQEGLGRFDQYVSRPIAVRPYDNSLAAPLPMGMRFTPVGRGTFNYAAGGREGFSLWARVFLADGIGWSSWVNVTGNPTLTTFDLIDNSYVLNLQAIPYPGNAFVAANIVNVVVKVQFVVHGPVRGMIVDMDFANQMSLPPETVFDQGLWTDLGGSR